MTSADQVWFAMEKGFDGEYHSSVFFQGDSPARTVSGRSRDFKFEAKQVSRSEFDEIGLYGLQIKYGSSKEELELLIKGGAVKDVALLDMIVRRLKEFQDGDQ